MTKEKILIVTSEFPPQPGGIGNHAYNLCLFLSKNNYDITVIADERDFQSKEEFEFDNSHNFEVRRIRLRKFRLLMYFNRIFTTLRAMRYADYVIATGKFSLWNVALSKSFIKRPSIAIIHGSEVNLKSTIFRRFTDWALIRYDSIIAVSNFTKKLVAHLKREVKIIPNGIDIQKWKITNSEKKALAGSPKLMTVGRVSKRKGQLQVIRLLPELINYYPEIHYHCIGIPTEENNFLDYAKKMGIEGHITFHGALPQDTLKTTLHSADIFVMLSTEDKDGDVEGFGIAILEANALGIPSIGSLGTGIEDAIDNGFSGFLISATDARKCVDSISRLMVDYEAYSKQARQWAEKHDWRIIVEQYIETIKHFKKEK